MCSVKIDTSVNILNLFNCIRNIKITIIMENGTISNQLMQSWGYTASAIVLSINGFFGFTLNFSVIILMYKDSQVIYLNTT